MPVSVDQESLDAARLGLTTVGEALAWAGRDGRMAVKLLIDGEAPDLSRMDALRATALGERHIYIETVDTRQTALETIAAAERRLGEAAEIKDSVVALLRENKWTEAMGKLGNCLGGWLEAQRAGGAVAKMFRISLNSLETDGRTVAELSADFAGQLRRIQTAIQGNDVIGMIDLLVYETEESSRRWRLALQALAERIGAAYPVRSAA